MEKIIALLILVAVEIGGQPDSEWADGCLFAHNTARDLHVDTPQMIWNSTLAAEAQGYVDSQIGNDSVGHSTGSGYGENIYWMEDYGTSLQLPCALAVYAWYREMVNAKYDFTLPFYQQPGNDTSHFTQVVWKDSTEVGCGMSSEDWYILCLYISPGNMNNGNDADAISNVAPLKESSVAPTSPGQLMAECIDMFPDDYQICTNLNCGDSYGTDFGPSTICPKTCGGC